MLEPSAPEEPRPERSEERRWTNRSARKETSVSVEMANGGFMGRLVSGQFADSYVEPPGKGQAF